MAKKVTGYIKLQIPAGKATPAPPVGPALGQHGVNIVQFTKEFNARTADKGDLIIPVVITVYQDRTFSFITKTPPVGPALGQHGVNIVQFTKEFNARTADKGDLIIPVVITVYQDRTFSFITKTPPAAVLLKKYCNIKSGSGVPNKTKVASISKDKVKEIAEMKMPDLNAASIEAAMSMIAGTARSMGITVED